MRDVRGCFFRIILRSKITILCSFFSVDVNGIVRVYFMNTCEKRFSLAKFCFFSPGRDGLQQGAMGRDGARQGATGRNRVLKSRLGSMRICRDT